MEFGEEFQENVELHTKPSSVPNVESGNRIKDWGFPLKKSENCSLKGQGLGSRQSHLPALLAPGRIIYQLKLTILGA